MKNKTIAAWENTEESFDWLIGRRVVEAHMEKVPFTSYTHYGESVYSNKDMSDGYIVLDDGTKAYIKSNEGNGWDGAGEYEITHLAEIDNIITRVSLDTEHDDSNYSSTTYRIFVYAGLEEYTLLQVEGDDGNGYYGTGYEITVVFPDA